MCSERAGVVAWCPSESGWRYILELAVENGHFSSIKMGDELLSPKHANAQEFILPGLTDAHVHVTENPALKGGAGTNLSPSHTLVDEDATYKQVIRNLQVSLRAGVTTLRDVGSLGKNSAVILSRLEDERRRGVVLPRVVSAGWFLTKPNGHAVDRGFNVRDGNNLADVIKTLSDRGASFIKVMNDPMVFTLEELKAIRQATTALGLPLAVHAFTDSSVRLALEAGVDVIEHAGTYSDSTIESISKSERYVVTTFIAALDTVVDPVGCCAEHLFEDANFQIFKDWYTSCCEYIPKLYKAGVKLLCGTDAGFPGTDFDSLPREICALEMLGIPVMTGVNLATIAPAELLGLKGILGEIREGAWADYSIFDRNPLFEPPRLRNPSHVFCSGVKAF